MKDCLDSRTDGLDRADIAKEELIARMCVSTRHCQTGRDHMRHDQHGRCIGTWRLRDESSSIRQYPNFKFEKRCMMVFATVRYGSSFQLQFQASSFSVQDVVYMLFGDKPL